MPNWSDDLHFSERRMADFLGRIFDRKYRLVRLIGEGGMGEVYEAEHTLIDRRVAVKVMHSEFTSSEEVVNRFFREAQAAGSIGHPNIIEIFDVGQEEDGTAFIVMELLKGHSLSSELKQGGAVAPARAVSIILQVLSALAASHEKGIIHRDLKPDNVFLAIDNRGRPEVKLLDFGIAKMQSEAEGDTGLTKTGTVLGTPNYMSPEAARGKGIDGRIDIWAAGVMLYEMLSGRLPFRGSSYNAVLSDILLETPPSVAKLAPHLSPALVQVVEKAMEKDRDQRYLTVAAMIADLMPFIEDTSLSDTAALALKNSLTPPPPLNDTMLVPSIDAFSMAAASGYSPETGMQPPGAGPGFDIGTGPGFAPPGVPSVAAPAAAMSPKRRGKTVPIVLAAAVLSAGGLALAFKTEGQTLEESGVALFDEAMGFWKQTSLWPGDKRVHVPPPEVDEPELNPEPDMSEGADPFVDADLPELSDNTVLSVDAAVPKAEGKAKKRNKKKRPKKKIH